MVLLAHQITVACVRRFSNPTLFTASLRSFPTLKTGCLLDLTGNHAHLVVVNRQPALSNCDP